jgi:hypothetical protein
MPSTPFAPFHVGMFDVAAVQRDFWGGFDSRQLHNKISWSGLDALASGVSIFISESEWWPLVALIRRGWFSAKPAAGPHTIE